MTKQIPQVLKGFRDYLPSEQIARKKIITKISEVFERFGFAPIDTPALEPYELFKGKIGEDEKLIYRFEDLGGREVSLRYDLTVPLARVVSDYRDLPKPFKRYQIGNVWRADKPQKGRYRELMQCDIDIVGTTSKLADAEVIAALIAAYNSLEVGNFLVKFNNRELVDQALTKLKVPKNMVPAFFRIIDKIAKIGEKKVVEMLVEKGFEKNILTKYSSTIEDISKDYVEEMENLLSGMGVENMKFDKYLMRGQDYYTGIIFEFELIEKPEFGSVGGGGRYDNLIGNVTGIETPAVGGSIGLDRLFAALSESKLIAPQTTAEVLVMNLDESLTAEYLNMVTNLRAAGIDCEFYYEPVKMDKQFKYAIAKNMKLAIIFGSEEAKQQKVNVKNLQEKRQTTVELANLVTEVKSMLW
ncbi:MAG: histidine--tRNA ligase [Candidatus Doudnabacteria bacterium]|nr:histidine--tRNA ligase [Candidatus Doudnabacteria bacterium]